MKTLAFLMGLVVAAGVVGIVVRSTMRRVGVFKYEVRQAVPNVPPAALANWPRPGRDARPG